MVRSLCANSCVIWQNTPSTILGRRSRNIKLRRRFSSADRKANRKPGFAWFGVSVQTPALFGKTRPRPSWDADQGISNCDGGFRPQIEKLTASQVLHGSESLCKLLRYLAKHALDHPGTPIKEYQIATEVFGRSADFDPQLDSMVRVQAGRLRGKLAEYYSANGADDGVVVELPKGNYVLSFHHHALGRRAHLNPPVETEWQGLRAGHSQRKWIVASISLGALLLAAGVTILWLLWNRSSAQAGAADLAPAAFRVFWNSFVSGQEEPWVIFSNAAFVGRPETGMRYYDTAKDKGTFILDHYTGVGE